MPEGYIKMRNKFMREGYSRKKAEEKAAKIWNAEHPDNPVGRGQH